MRESCLNCGKKLPEGRLLFCDDICDGEFMGERPQRPGKAARERAALLATMEGQEIISTTFEACVGIKDGQVWRDGEMIVKRPSTAQVNALWAELMEQEGIR